MTEPRQIIHSTIRGEFTDETARSLTDQIIRALGQAGWGFVPLGVSNAVWVGPPAAPTVVRQRSKGHLTLIDGGGEG